MKGLTYSGGVDESRKYTYYRCRGHTPYIALKDLEETGTIVALLCGIDIGYEICYTVTLDSNFRVTKY